MQSRHSKKQIYEVEEDSLSLVGTAEIPLAGMHADDIIAEERMPMKLAAYGRYQPLPSESGRWSVRE